MTAATATRRDFLKGISLSAGGVVLAPLCQQLQAQALAAESPTSRRPAPKRFVFVLEGNGLNWDQIQPVGMQRPKEHERTTLVNRPHAEYPLPKALEPVADFRDRLTIVQGLSGRVAGGGHSNDFGALGCYSGKGGQVLGETIDAALAKRLTGVFPHVGLGMVEKLEQPVVYNCSAWERGKALPTTCSPELAYANLFGSVAGGAAKQEFLARGNMLDFLIDDVKRLERSVAGAERAKLDAHLAAYESLRDRQSRLNELESTLRKQAPVVSDKFKSPVETDRLDAQFDIGAAALIGGLTNVLTLSSGSGNPYFSVKFTGLGIHFGKHSIGHGGSYNGMIWSEMATIIRRFHFELIARLMRKLDAVPEGDGTMLDSTVIVYMSDSAESHHSRCWEWPFVLLTGRRTGLAGGRYVEYPYWGQAGHRQIGHLYTTLLSTIGDERAYFGQREAQLKDIDVDGPLSELLV